MKNFIDTDSFKQSSKNLKDELSVFNDKINLSNVHNILAITLEFNNYNTLKAYFDANKVIENLDLEKASLLFNEQLKNFKINIDILEARYLLTKSFQIISEIDFLENLTSKVSNLENQNELILSKLEQINDFFEYELPLSRKKYEFNSLKELSEYFSELNGLNDLDTIGELVEILLSIGTLEKVYTFYDEHYLLNDLDEKILEMSIKEVNEEQYFDEIELILDTAKDLLYYQNRVLTQENFERIDEERIARGEDDY